MFVFIKFMDMLISCRMAHKEQHTGHEDWRGEL